MEINNDTLLMQVARADNKYLGSEELPKNKDQILTIKQIVQESILNPKNNKTSTKTTMYFAEPEWKPMVCNKTNLTAVHKATGAETVGEAIGHKIALYCDPNVKFGGKTTGGIRISPYNIDSDEYKADVQSRDQLYGRESFICEVCGKEIRGAGGKTAGEVAQIGKKQFGKQMCVDCMKKAKAKESK